MSEKSKDESDVEELEKYRFDLSDKTDVIKLVQGYGNDEDKIREQVYLHIEELITSSGLDQKHNVVFLYDDHRPIGSVHSDQIYRCLSEFENEKDVLLIVHSRGGSIEPAYLISKTCQRLCRASFKVAIPRRAKSAATLISLGADEIHMGLMSELGPIDPQINNVPAVAISNALKKIAELSSAYPSSSDMFSKFLTDNLSLSTLGYFERINESATQYATRLLSNKEFKKPDAVDSLADHFTNHYKDHSFVIDVDESRELLGSDVVREDTREYQLANSIYQFLDFFEFVIGIILEKQASIVGNGSKSSIQFHKKDGTQ